MSLSPLESMVSRVGVEPTTSRLRVRIAPVSLSCAELPSGRLSVAESGLLGFGSSAECRPVRLSAAELSTAGQPRFRESVRSNGRAARRVDPELERRAFFAKDPIGLFQPAGPTRFGTRRAVE